MLHTLVESLQTVSTEDLQQSSFAAGRGIDSGSHASAHAGTAPLPRRRGSASGHAAGHSGGPSSRAAAAAPLLPRRRSSASGKPLALQAGQQSGQHCWSYLDHNLEVLLASLISSAEPEGQGHCSESSSSESAVSDSGSRCSSDGAPHAASEHATHAARARGAHATAREAAFCMMGAWQEVEVLPFRDHVTGKEVGGCCS